MWRLLKCPECGFDGWTTRTGDMFCGNCAGDCGKDVTMDECQTRVERPSDEELQKAEANRSWQKQE